MKSHSVFALTFYIKYLNVNFWVCVPPIISYYLYFLRVSKVSSMYTTCQWGKFRVKNATFHITFLAFSKKLCFYQFHFLFWWSNKFSQQNINQSETGIGDKKLSVELCVKRIVACISAIQILKTWPKAYVCNKPAGIYLLKVNNENTRTMCEICSKLTNKTPQRCQWRHSAVFIVNFE